MFRGLVITCCVLGSVSVAFSQDFPEVVRVERQPLIEATKRLVETLDFIGEPLSAEEKQALSAAFELETDREVTEAIQDVLDPHCLAGVHINAESRVKVSEGPCPKELMEHGWRSFLVKVHNEAGINPKLAIESPNALAVYERGRGARQRPKTDQDLIDRPEVERRFLDVSMYDSQPMRGRLSGLELEYRIAQLYSRDTGKREAQISFHVGQGTQDIGFRNSVPILFECQPAVEVTLGILDHDGSPTMAALVIRDRFGRVYPNPSKRLAPDFFFHEQVYRQDGETVRLPPGDYTVAISRGPEYEVERTSFTVSASPNQRVPFQLTRWIHPAKKGWISGDHHVHAAGCAHYDSPTEGVGPEDMMRHILGEDLNVGCVLSWGPCWYTQKEYFEGATHELSTEKYLMRYDVEVSGFPSSHAGHLCLLRLIEDDYPGTTLIEEWPSWTLPVLKWGKEQGGVVGYSHSGWGLALPDVGPNGQRLRSGANQQVQGSAVATLPDYEIPPFDGIGANEYIVTAAHGVCDFISAVDTPAIWELNIWYHTLNCGLRSRISGETDFPCIYGDRVGLGRIYVKQDGDGPVNFDTWIQGVKDGRSYCGDGLSHLMNFRVNDVAVGEPGTSGEISQLELKEAGLVTVQCEVAALLESEPSTTAQLIRQRRLDQKPYWHIERCRVGATRKVPVELIVNGQVAERVEIEADGEINDLKFETQLDQSSWVAVRILPSCHTNPVFVEVDGKPIRASRRSAEWCRDSVDVCWKSKSPMIRESERAEAEKAYDQAREYYSQVLSEAVTD
ncbi:CehA/McbA family metallohydrolase [Thalassoglobus sp. JC818]|uniref:CehA/McbA family metallohydrolase n=1 Tax=Thalassoglobus sp. JC818 TaxID=3232136 RepID=UPI003458B527